MFRPEEGSLVGERMSLSRQSSGETLYGERQDAYPYPRRGFAAPQLPAINSGEPLDWDVLHRAPSDDPFSDTTPPVYHQPAPHAPAFQPPALITHNTSQSSLSDQYYLPERTSWNVPSRPVSAYSAVTSNTTGYTYIPPAEKQPPTMYPTNASNRASFCPYFLQQCNST